MTGRLKKLFAIAAMGLALAGCESGVDKARKADVAEDIVKQSVTYCQTGPVNGSPAAYGQRLRDILLQTRTADMDVLKNNNIIVCLDQRLANQKTGWLDTRMEGVYYNNGGQGGVLSLWDDGSEPGFWHKDASDWGSSLIHDFTYQVNKGRIKPADNRWYGYEYSYTTSCGQNCTTTNYDVDWTREGRFDKDTIRKNAEIVQKAPLKETAPERAPGQW